MGPVDDDVSTENVETTEEPPEDTQEDSGWGDSPVEEDETDADFDDTTDDRVRRMQRAVRAKTDGVWGSDTDERIMQMRTAARGKQGFDIKVVQEIIGTTVDGVWSSLSRGALSNWVVRFQNIMNVRRDGQWGPKTDGKLLAVRRKNLKKS